MEHKDLKEALKEFENDDFEAILCQTQKELVIQLNVTQQWILQ